MSNKASKSELESVVLSGLLQDSNVMGLVESDIKSTYFDNEVHQRMFSIIKEFYSEYQKSPNKTELVSMMNGFKANPGSSDLDKDVADLCITYYGAEPVSEKYLKDVIESFVSKARLEEVISKAIEGVNKNTGKFSIDDLADDIVDARSYSIMEDDITKLSDYSKYSENRDKYYGSEGTPRVVRSSMNQINYALTAGGYVPGDLVVFTAAPAVGKSVILANESIAASMQGYTTLHVILGDMNEVSISHRIMASVTNFPIREFYKNEKLTKEVVSSPMAMSTGVFDRIHTISYPPLVVTTNKLITVVKKLQDKYQVHYDLIVVDYADNLSPESHQSYESSGVIYAKLKELAKTNLSVVITASQPKLAYFNSEIVPFDGLAESSKKQHVVDAMINIGKPSRDADIATAFIAKLREGKTGGIFRLGFTYNVSRVKVIDEATYYNRKAELRGEVVEDDEPGTALEV